MARPRLLDLTRSLRRAGRTATGIDRVERAYLDAFLSDAAVPALGLVRTPRGYLLIDAAGLARFAALAPAGPEETLRAVRRLAVARCLPWGLARMLRRAFPGGVDYYNVGHSNLTARVLRAVGATGGRRHVLVHDVIPLDYPQFQGEGTVAPFRDRMRRVAMLADRVIYNSQYTRSRAERHFRAWGAVPDGIVAHLGTIVPRPAPAALPKGLPPPGPYFVALGTIEPRKNHAFLLDLWQAMGPRAPGLVICGRRGWNNAAVFARLDALDPAGPVREVAGLDDGAVAALLQGSCGLLFPSVAEGFGLPPVEARTLGARVLCNDLPVLREVLGDAALYADVSAPETWQAAITNWAKAPPDAQELTAYTGPRWDDHFKAVLTSK